MTRLLLIRHAPSRSTRRAAFALDEPLDEAGSRQAAGLGARLPGRIDRWLASPALTARQTAEAAGLTTELDPDLSECDFGKWAGCTLEEIQSADPEGLRAWFDDPDAAPHGGESIAQLIARTTKVLDRIHSSPASTGALTHSGVIRAAVVVALEAPVKSFWRIDVAPLSVTELHSSAYGWRLTGLNRDTK